MARHDDPAQVEIRIWAAVLLRHLDDLAAEVHEVRVRRAQTATVRAHQRLTLHRPRVGHFADAIVMVLKIGGFHYASRGCAVDRSGDASGSCGSYVLILWQTL